MPGFSLLDDNNPNFNGYVTEGPLVREIVEPGTSSFAGLVVGREYTVTISVKPENAATAKAKFSILSLRCTDDDQGIGSGEIVTLSDTETEIDDTGFHTISQTFVFDGTQKAFGVRSNAAFALDLGPGVTFFVDDFSVTETVSQKSRLTDFCFLASDELQSTLLYQDLQERSGNIIFLNGATSGIGYGSMKKGHLYEVSIPVKLTNKASASGHLTILSSDCGNPPPDGEAVEASLVPKTIFPLVSKEVDLTSAGGGVVTAQFVYTGSAPMTTFATTSVMKLSAPIDVGFTSGGKYIIRDLTTGEEGEYPHEDKHVYPSESSSSSSSSSSSGAPLSAVTCDETGLPSLRDNGADLDGYVAHGPVKFLPFHPTLGGYQGLTVGQQYTASIWVRTASETTAQVRFSAEAGRCIAADASSDQKFEAELTTIASMTAEMSAQNARQLELIFNHTGEAYSDGRANTLFSVDLEGDSAFIVEDFRIRDNLTGEAMLTNFCEPSLITLLSVWGSPYGVPFATLWDPREGRSPSGLVTGREYRVLTEIEWSSSVPTTVKKAIVTGHCVPFHQDGTQSSGGRALTDITVLHEVEIDLQPGVNRFPDARFLYTGPTLHNSRAAIQVLQFPDDVASSNHPRKNIIIDVETGAATPSFGTGTSRLEAQ